jgi:hypothetical protein
MAESLTDLLINRYTAKQKEGTPTNLMAAMGYATDEELARKTSDDPYISDSVYKATANSPLGIMHESGSNLVASVKDYANKEQKQIIARNKAIADKQAIDFQNKKDFINFGVKTEQEQYDRGQTTITGQATADALAESIRASKEREDIDRFRYTSSNKNSIAENQIRQAELTEDQRRNGVTESQVDVTQDEINRSALAEETEKNRAAEVEEAAKQAAVDLAASKLLKKELGSKHKTKILGDDLAFEKATENSKFGDLTESFLKGGGDLTDEPSLLAAMKKFGIRDERLEDVKTSVTKQQDVLIKQDRVSWDAAKEATALQFNTDLEDLVYRPLRENIDNKGREYGISPEGMKALTSDTTDNYSVSGAYDVLTEIIKPADGGVIPTSQTEDISSAINSVMDKYGGFGFNMPAFKTAVARSLDQTFFTMNADVKEKKLLDAYDKQMAAMGLGQGEGAEGRRELIKTVKDMQRGLAKVKKNATTQENRFNIAAEQETVQGILGKNYRGEGQKVPTGYRGSGLSAFVQENIPQGPLSDTPAEATENILSPAQVERIKWMQNTERDQRGNQIGEPTIDTSASSTTSEAMDRAVEKYNTSNPQQKELADRRLRSAQMVEELKRTNPNYR